MAGTPDKTSIGSRWGRLTIIGDTGKRSGNGSVIWLCRCDCGKEVERQIGSLRLSKKIGSVTSCGCYMDEYHKTRSIGKEQLDNPVRRQRAREALGRIDGTTMQGIKRVKLNKNNSTGVRGVSYNKKRGIYYAQLCLRGYTYRKEFKDLNDAIRYRKWLEDTYVKPIIRDYEEEHGEYCGKASRRYLRKHERE